MSPATSRSIAADKPAARAPAPERQMPTGWTHIESPGKQSAHNPCAQPAANRTTPGWRRRQPAPGSATTNRSASLQRLLQLRPNIFGGCSGRLSFDLLLTARGLLGLEIGLHGIQRLAEVRRRDCNRALG